MPRESAQAPYRMIAISKADHTTFTHSLLDPAHGIIKESEELLLTLDPMHKISIEFLNSLDDVSACDTIKLEFLCDRPATDVVETLSSIVTNLIHSSYQVALETCHTKIILPDHTHYNPMSAS